MTKDKSKTNEPTGKAVRDSNEATIGATTTDLPVPNQMQIHPGNTAVLTVKMLDEINTQLKRIAEALEKANG